MNHPLKLRAFGATLALLASAATSPPLAAQQRVPQVLEDSAQRITLNGDAAPSSVCHPGARWIRLGFGELVLAPGDTLELVSSDGDRLAFADGRWNTRSFHSRALRGDCITINASFSGDGSRYSLQSYDAGSLPLYDSRVTIGGAGDICNSSTANCQRTSDLLLDMNPTAVFTLGDAAYPYGTLSQFNTYYHPNWGRLKAITFPIPGNHEYQTSNARGYFDYFNGVGVQDGPAGNRSLGYYSYDVGEWHVVALNSRSAGTVSSTQLNWLSADLAANTKPCVAALVHHPLVSRGKYTSFSAMRPFYDRLYAAKADLVLAAHDHNYQRYGKMDSYQSATTDGLRQVIVGTGGAEVYPLKGTHALLQASRGDTYGVLRLDLSATGYAGTFVAKGGNAWTDDFSAPCNKGPRLTPDFTVAAATSPLALVRGGTATQSVTVESAGGFSSSVRLTLSGLPSGTSYSFSPSTVTPAANGSVKSTLTLRAVSTTWTGSLNAKVRATAGTEQRTTNFRLVVQ